MIPAFCKRKESLDYETRISNDSDILEKNLEQDLPFITFLQVLGISYKIISCVDNHQEEIGWNETVFSIFFFTKYRLKRKFRNLHEYEYVIYLCH